MFHKEPTSLLCLTYTKFEDIDVDGNVEAVWYGYRLFCDEAADYYNMFRSFEDLRQAVNEETIVDWIYDHHEGHDGTFDFANIMEESGGVILNNEWLEVV